MDTWQDWVKIVRVNPNKTMDLNVERNGVIIQVELTPKSKVTDGETMGYIGAYQEQSKVLFERFWTIESYGIAAALTHALDKTWSMSVVTVKLLGKLVSGDASLKNISGPITIAKFAGQSAETGFDHYLYFMAIISLSLGILNLLPIPVLDGGHLMFYFAEVIKGSPVSEKTQIIGQNIGLAILGTMMVIAFYNDIMRLLQ
jgi:regulator of sigma E protease